MTSAATSTSSTTTEIHSTEVGDSGTRVVFLHGLFGQGEEEEKIEPAIAACRAKGWNVEGPLPADTLFFRAGRGDFDLVVAMYVMTVVPDPQGTMAELERVCRPGGDILIVNHFAADRPGIRRSVEGWMAPFSKKLGWRPDFTLDTLMSGSRLTVETVETVPPFGLFSLLHCRRSADAVA